MWAVRFRPWALYNMRVWFNGRTSAFQAEDEGSIPFTRSYQKYFMFLFCANGSVVEHRLAKARAAGSNPVSRSFYARIYLKQNKSRIPSSKKYSLDCQKSNKYIKSVADFNTQVVSERNRIARRATFPQGKALMVSERCRIARRAAFPQGKALSVSFACPSSK